MVEIGKTGSAQQAIGETQPRSEAQAISAARAQPLPAGVFLVRTDRRVAALHVDPHGAGLQTEVNGEWQPLPKLTRVRRGIIRSRVHLRFADGSKRLVRPYPIGLKSMLEVGRKDTFATDTGGGGSDPFTTFFLMLLLLILIVPSLFFLVRELTGVSSRARQADVLIAQLAPLLTS